MSCPYGKADCQPLDGLPDVWVMPDGTIHHHDHTRCVFIAYPTGWYYPGEAYPHAEPALYLAARDPLQARWPTPWQVIATSLCMVRTSRAQALNVLPILYHQAPTPHHLLRLNLEQLLTPLGLAPSRARYLRRLAERWSYWHPSIEWVSSQLGCGRYVTDAYRIFVLGERPEVRDPVLAMHLQLTSPNGT